MVSLSLAELVRFVGNIGNWGHDVKVKFNIGLDRSGRKS